MIVMNLVDMNTAQVVLTETVDHIPRAGDTVDYLHSKRVILEPDSPQFVVIRTHHMFERASTGDICHTVNVFVRRDNA